LCFVCVLIQWMDILINMEKKIDPAFTCTECNNSDSDKLMIIRDAPWVVECTVCGHPNDARWDHDMIDVF
jgi:transcription elongation factor Elf1